jgi:hypothetical protein
VTATQTTCPACGGSTAVEPHDPNCPMSIYPVPTPQKGR